jgi:hypothetical protein
VALSEFLTLFAALSRRENNGLDPNVSLVPKYVSHNCADSFTSEHHHSCASCPSTFSISDPLVLTDPRTSSVWGDPKSAQGQSESPMTEAPPQPAPVPQPPPPSSQFGAAWGGAGLPDKRQVCHAFGALRIHLHKHLQWFWCGRIRSPYDLMFAGKCAAEAGRFSYLGQYC